MAVLHPDVRARAREYGFDSMLYNNIEDLIPEGFTKMDFCTFCVSHKSPLNKEAGAEKYLEELLAAA